MSWSFSQLVRGLVTMSFVGFFVTLFIPLKLRLVEPAVFLSGDFNPYTTSYLYLSDIFFLFGLFLVGVSYFFLSRESNESHVDQQIGDWPFVLFFCFLVFASIISYFASSSTPESLLYSWRWVEVLVLYLLVSRKVIPLEIIARIFVWAMIFQTALAGLQYLKGASLGLSIIGESSLHIGEPGVATVRMFGRSFLRGYGTFLHPNIFAAYAFFGIFLSSLYRKTRPFFFSFAVVFLALGVVISFSRMALVALIIFFLVSFYKKQVRSRRIVMSLFVVVGVVGIGFFLGLSRIIIERFHFTDMASLQFRYANFVDGARLFFHSPFGVGLGGSTIAMQEVSVSKYAPWQYQPAHNLFLVAGNELGFFGFMIFGIGAFFLFRFLFLHRKEYPLHMAVWISFFCLSLSDHFFFTLYHGQILLVLFLSFLALVGRESSPSSHLEMS